MTKKKVCLFGVSANPPTGNNGHVGIVTALINLNVYEEIRILPVYRHAFCSKRDQLVDFSHRAAMCELAFLRLNTTGTTKRYSDTKAAPAAKLAKVVVSRAEERSFKRMCSSLSSLKMRRGETELSEEEKSNIRVGTADLLEMLMEQEDKNLRDKEETIPHQATEFSFCLGADTFMDLTDWEWKRSKDVLRLLEGRLVVVNRMQDPPQHKNQQLQQDKIDKGKTVESSLKLLRERIDEINKLFNFDGKVILLNVPTLGNVSSSMARSFCINGDVKNLETIVPSAVLDYISKNKLYGFNEKVNLDDDEYNNKATGDGKYIR